MKTLPFFFALSLSVCVVAGAGLKKPPEPEGEPAYARQAEGWSFACWIYKNSRAVHGRLLNKDGEVFGKRVGETIKTSFGTLVWRGHYSPESPPEKSTGWLFIESFTGPPYIRDRYDPKTNTLN